MDTAQGPVRRILRIRPNDYFSPGGERDCCHGITVPVALPVGSSPIDCAAIDECRVDYADYLDHLSLRLAALILIALDLHGVSLPFGGIALHQALKP